MIATKENPSLRITAPTLARRLSETAHRSPLAWRAATLGVRDGWDLLALAVERGCRHCAGIAPERAVIDPGEAAISNEELVMLLLAGSHAFEPFLIRAAAELLRAAPMDVGRLAKLAKRERCARALAHIALAGVTHDPTGGAFWPELLAALGPTKSVAPGVLPHWSRFAVQQGVAQGGRELGSRWAGAAP